MKKYLWVGLAVILILMITKYTNGGDTDRNITTPKNIKPSTGYLEIEKNNIELGEIEMSKGNVDIAFTFTNTDEEPVLILSGETSCMCTDAIVETSGKVISPKITMRGHSGASWPTGYTQEIKAGETAKLTATFDPNAHGPNATGPIIRQVYLYTNSTKTPELEFIFTGNVTK